MNRSAHPRHLVPAGLVALGLTAVLMGCSLNNPHAIGTLERARFWSEKDHHQEAADAYEVFVRQNPTDPQADRAQFEKALAYMDLKPGALMTEIPIDTVFIGSCTNGRLTDLIQAAELIKGRKIAPTVRALAVPGSGKVKSLAEEMGLDRIFIDAGFEWRAPGCSMCLAMNPDQVGPGMRAASTSNRNFQDRQGQGSRTHLVSPATAAVSALTGRLTDVRKWVCTA